MSELEAITMLYDGLEEKAYYAGRVDAEIAKLKEEIAKLKEEIKELKLTLGWGSIVTDNLMLRPDDKEYIRQGHEFVKLADEAAK